MAASDVHEMLYDEAQEWLGAGCNVELNVAGTWIPVERLSYGYDGIVKCHTSTGVLWLALEELKAIREIQDVPLST